jgi:hypothetical protein
MPVPADSTDPARRDLRNRARASTATISASGCGSVMTFALPTDAGALPIQPPDQSLATTAIGRIEKNGRDGPSLQSTSGLW